MVFNLLTPSMVCLNADNNTYVAHAYLNDDKPTKSLQSVMVRRLLTWLQQRLHLQGALIETAFPYYFIDNKKYFVCFSHSGNQIALIISQAPCSIDIEIHPIRPAIAKRFYHINEINELSTILSDQQHHYRRWLWQLKECLIKYECGFLTQGLGVDCSAHLKTLLKIHHLTNSQCLFFMDDKLCIYSDFNQHYTALFHHTI